MKNQSINRLYIVFAILFFSLALSSCKSSKDFVSNARLRNLSTNRLLKNLESNAFDYKKMEIKRISCQFDDGTQKTSFKGHLRAVNDDKILLTFNKINVPVGKVLLSKDSVKFINYINKNYFLDDYSYLSDLLNIDLNYEAVNAIISNNAFSYRDDKHNNDFREFTSGIDSGMYVLKSIKNRKLDKIMRKGNDKKVERLLKKLDQESLILQTLYIDPDFKLRKIVLDDEFNKRLVTITYNEFTKVGRQIYPGEIKMAFKSPGKHMEMNIKLSKVEMARKVNFNFKIPDRYDLMEH